MSEQIPGEQMAKFRALVTLGLEDQEIISREECDQLGITNDDLPALLGCAVAEVGNWVKLIAAEWGCKPTEAWAAVRTAAETLRLR